MDRDGYMTTRDEAEVIARAWAVLDEEQIADCQEIAYEIAGKIANEEQVAEEYIATLVDVLTRNFRPSDRDQ
jgi:hypothetical protein